MVAGSAIDPGSASGTEYLAHGLGKLGKEPKRPTRRQAAAQCCAQSGMMGKGFSCTAVPITIVHGGLPLQWSKEVAAEHAIALD